MGVAATRFAKARTDGTLAGDGDRSSSSGRLSWIRSVTGETAIASIVVSAATGLTSSTARGDGVSFARSFSRSHVANGAVKGDSASRTRSHAQKVRFIAECPAAHARQAPKPAVEFRRGTRAFLCRDPPAAARNRLASYERFCRDASICLQLCIIRTLELDLHWRRSRLALHRQSSRNETVLSWFVSMTT
jgi:hypothetical protein